MNEKRQKIEAFIRNYHKLTEQEKSLLFIQKGMEEQRNISLKAELTVEGQTFPLHELVDGSDQELYASFEEDIALFIAYLLQVNQTKLEELILFLEPKEQTKEKEETPIKERMDITEKDGSILLSDTLRERIIEKVEGYEKNTILNPTELFDSLSLTLKEQISLSDIHEVLRNYVDENKMQLIHNATCYKCDSGYEQDYEKLPRDVTCGHCGADIVNIEIRYKKLY